MSGFRGGLKLGTIIAIIILILLPLVGCQAELTDGQRMMIQTRHETMALLTQFTVPPPALVYTQDRSFRLSGETDCKAQTITINYWVAATDPTFIAFVILPHEWAHWASCVRRGSTDAGSGNPHDNFWKEWVLRLGGDPEFI